MTNYISLPERQRRKRYYRNHKFSYTTLNYLSLDSLSVLPVLKKKKPKNKPLYKHIKNMCGHCPVKIKGTRCGLWWELVCIHTEHTRWKYRPDRNTDPGAFCGVKMHLNPGTSPANWPKNLSVLLKPHWIWCISLPVINLPTVALEERQKPCSDWLSDTGTWRKLPRILFLPNNISKWKKKTY